MYTVSIPLKHLKEINLLNSKATCSWFTPEHCSFQRKKGRAWTKKTRKAKWYWCRTKRMSGSCFHPRPLHTPNDTSICLSILEQVKRHTDRQTNTKRHWPRYICSTRPHLCTELYIDATTAEMLEGTSHPMDADPISFPPLSLPCLPLLLHPCFTHSLPYSSFLLHLNLARRSWEAL